MDSPKVGVAVLIFKDQKIMLGKRKGNHGAGTWAAPGGHLELNESFEDCAIREVKEETGVTIEMPEYLAVTNDVFKEDGKHYVTIFMCANFPDDQELKNLEPEKIESWEWCDLNKLPSKLFLPMKNLIGGDGLDLLLSLVGLGPETVEKH
jgi:8-oxo-dGTP diphosphatase